MKILASVILLSKESLGQRKDGERGSQRYCLEYEGAFQNTAEDGRSGSFGYTSSDKNQDCFLEAQAPSDCDIEWRLDQNFSLTSDIASYGSCYDSESVYLAWHDRDNLDSGRRQTALLCDFWKDYLADYYEEDTDGVYEYGENYQQYYYFTKHMNWQTINTNILTAHVHSEDAVQPGGYWTVQWRCVEKTRACCNSYKVAGVQDDTDARGEYTLLDGKYQNTKGFIMSNGEEGWTVADGDDGNELITSNVKQQCPDDPMEWKNSEGDELNRFSVICADEGEQWSLLYRHPWFGAGGNWWYGTDVDFNATDAHNDFDDENVPVNLQGDGDFFLEFKKFNEATGKYDWAAQKTVERAGHWQGTGEGEMNRVTLPNSDWDQLTIGKVVWYGHDQYDPEGFMLFAFDVFQLYHGDTLIHDFVQNSDCHIMYIGTHVDKSLPCYKNIAGVQRDWANNDKNHYKMVAFNPLSDIYEKLDDPKYSYNVLPKDQIEFYNTNVGHFDASKIDYWDSTKSHRVDISLFNPRHAQAFDRRPKWPRYLLSKQPVGQQITTWEIMLGKRDYRTAKDNKFLVGIAKDMRRRGKEFEFPDWNTFPISTSASAFKKTGIIALNLVSGMMSNGKDKLELDLDTIGYPWHDNLLYVRVILDAENKKLNFKFAEKKMGKEVESLDLAQRFEVDISDRFEPGDEYFPFVAIGNQDNAPNSEEYSKIGPLRIYRDLANDNPMTTDATTTTTTPSTPYPDDLCSTCATTGLTTWGDDCSIVLTCDVDVVSKNCYTVTTAKDNRSGSIVLHKPKTDQYCTFSIKLQPDCMRFKGRFDEDMELIPPRWGWGYWACNYGSVNVLSANKDAQNFCYNFQDAFKEMSEQDFEFDRSVLVQYKILINTHRVQQYFKFQWQCLTDSNEFEDDSCSAAQVDEQVELAIRDALVMDKVNYTRRERQFRKQERMYIKAAQRQDMWTRQFRKIWQDFKEEKTRERTLNPARRCIKQPSTFSKTDVGARCDLNISGMDSLCQNLESFLLDKMDTCRTAQDGEAPIITRLKKRCDLIVKATKRVMAQQARFVSALREDAHEINSLEDALQAGFIDEPMAIQLP